MRAFPFLPRASGVFPLRLADAQFTARTTTPLRKEVVDAACVALTHSRNAHFRKTPMNTASLIHSLALVTLTAAIAPSTASAAIVSVSGSATLLGAAPVSALYGALVGPPAYCWDEQPSILTTGTNVNITANGFYTGFTPYSALAAGTFASHMIHFDASSGVASVTGSATFSSPILAVLYENTLLSATDAIFGAPGTTYATGDPFRSSTAQLVSTQLLVSGNTLNFTLWANSAAWPNRMMQVRVFTDGTVPAPGAMALLGLAGLAARSRRR